MTDFLTSDLLAEVRRSLSAIGYRQDLIRENYPFRSAQKKGTVVPQIPMAAFAMTPLSERSSCLGVALPSNNSPEAIRPFRDLGAPQIIALHPENGLARRWRMTPDIPVSVEEFPLSHLPREFEANRRLWAPDRIYQAKRALPSNLPDHADQLDFLDMGLMPALEADLREKLDRDIQGVLSVCRNTYEQWHTETQFDTVQVPAFRLIFRLIAAKMLIDRGDQAQWRGMSVSQVLANVEDFYFSQKKAEPPLEDPLVQSAVWQHIHTGLDLQNLSVETLAYVYENTFVNKAARRDLGIHATPPEIAEYIVRHLPIGKLPEQERTVFEPFTGPAPFLVAAMGLLRELSTAPDDVTRHDYFRRMLMGIEVDPFAHEIARYSLILADYPNADGWHIACANAYGDARFDEYLQKANVVLCNPPFGLFPDGEQPEGALTLRDAEALRRILLRQPAMLGFVLPRTFLTKREYQSLRRDLAACYREISVVVLPEGTFTKTTVETVLLVAHNETTVTHRRSSLVTRDYRKRFLRSGEVAWEVVEDLKRSQRVEEGSLWLTPSHRLWDALSDMPKLGIWGRTRTGFRYKKQVSLSDRVSDSPSPGRVAGIYEYKGFLEPFFPLGTQYLSVEPRKLYRNPVLPWDQPKVIINGFRSTVGLWRMFGSVDVDGLRFSKQCLGVWPQQGTPVEVLAAVLNGPIANAYLTDHLAARDNQVNVIGQIPFPQFTPGQAESIVGLVQEYQSYRDQWFAEPDRASFLSRKCLELLWQIDAEVLAAYALLPVMERDLLNRFTGVDRSPLPFPFPGYGEGYEQAKQALLAKKQYQETNAQYQILVKKKHGTGLTAAEAVEMDRLGHLMDVFDAPRDLAMLRAVQDSG